MATVAASLIKGNGRFDLFSFVEGEDTFRVFVKQSNGELYTGKVSVYIKANNEKSHRIGFYQDSFEVSELEAYVREELVEA